VRAAIGRLPVQYRVPLVLREFESLRYDEIAGVLDLGVPAVKTRLHRGRAQLLSLLDGSSGKNSGDS
jgi:RNA polymerase sigma-70 factor (ECF subfamily)